MALAVLENEDFSTAKKLFAHSLRLGIPSCKPYIGIGICELKEGDFDKALKTFEEVPTNSEEYIESLIGKVYCLVLSKEPERSYESLKRLKEMNVWNQELELLSKTLSNKIQKSAFSAIEHGNIPSG
jgi:lipopolysaccharide biosynthesis regulator YciM